MTQYEKFLRKKRKSLSATPTNLGKPKEYVQKPDYNELHTFLREKRGEADEVVDDYLTSKETRVEIMILMVERVELGAARRV